MGIFFYLFISFQFWSIFIIVDCRFCASNGFDRYLFYGHKWYGMVLNGYFLCVAAAAAVGVFNVRAIGYVLLLDFCTLWPLIKW